MIFGLNFKEENTEANRILLQNVYRYAWNNSQDISTKTGAGIILKPNGLCGIRPPIVYGANRLKDGIEDMFSPEEITLKMKDSYWKRDAMSHAEPSSIEKAVRLGYDVSLATMVMPWIPCKPCAETMVKYKIKKLITHESFINKTPKDWKESTLKGVEELLDNNIEIVTYSGKIGDCDALFKGEHWRP